MRRGGVWLGALLAVLALSGGRVASVAAQDASPAATPMATCTPAAGDGAMGGMDMGATPAASPVAGEEPVGVPADQATAAAVAAAAENVVACYNTGDVEAFLGLVTDYFVQDVLGAADKDEAAVWLSGEGGITPLEDFEVDAGTAKAYDDGRYSVDVTYTQFDYQFVAARWFFVESGSDLLLDDEDLINPEPDVDFVTIISASVAADEGATLVLDQTTSVPTTEAIVLHLTNNGAIDRDIFVVKLPEGTALTEDGALPEDLASVEAIFAAEGVAIVAYIGVDAGDTVDTALIDLPVGVYVLIDQTDGTIVPLTVTAPAE